MAVASVHLYWLCHPLAIKDGYDSNKPLPVPLALHASFRVFALFLRFSFSREKTGEESYLARGKSFKGKQDRSVSDGANHDQRGDAQKSGGVPH